MDPAIRSYYTAAAIILVNVVILAYVWRARDRARSGFFLTTNAAALILWGIGSILSTLFPDTPPAELLMLFAALTVPGNFLYFAATRPAPIGRFWSSPWIVVLVFLPAVLLPWLFGAEPGSDGAFGLKLDLAQGPAGAAPRLMTAVYVIGCYAAAASILVARYLSALDGPDRVLSMHLTGTIAGPPLFALFFWIITRQGTAGVVPPLVPLAMLTAQVGSLLVLRQEEVDRPAPLRRFIYYGLVLLGATVATGLLLQIWAIVSESTVEPATMNAVYLLALGAVALLAMQRGPQLLFERIVFRRVHEYRRLYQETQRELRETRERLRRAERLSMMGELSARIAHEIKNPLGPIKGYTQMLREKIETLDVPQRERMLSHLEVIAEEAENIDRKVHQLLNIAKRREPLRSEVQVNTIVERTAALLRFDTASSGMPRAPQLELDLDPALPTIIADRERIEEAVFNLASNAVDAAGPDGRVTIMTFADPSPSGEPGILVVVTDTGPGITDEARQNLFKPFFTEKLDGTGLGLVITRSHVDEHGGTLEIERREGGGTEARMWLPRHASTAARAEELPDVRGDFGATPRPVRPLR
jgi:signal transduction histidine kinase